MTHIKLIELSIGSAFGAGTIHIPSIEINWPETLKHKKMLLASGKSSRKPLEK